MRTDKIQNPKMRAKQSEFAVFGQIVPNILPPDEAVLNFHSVYETYALKGFPIEPGALQGAMTKHHSGVALPAFFKLIVMFGNADVAILRPDEQLWE